MKSIKEKAKEYRRVIKVINEYESLIDTGNSEMFEAGANYVLDIIEQLVYEKHVKGNLPLFDLTHLIDKLKKK